MRASLVCLVLLAACTPAATWKDLDAGKLTPEQQRRLGLAQTACKELGENLKAKLLEAIGKGGPAAAIDVCRVAAPAIANDVAAAQKVRIGRTSHKLRNPANAAPAWAAAHVAKAKGDMALRESPDGTLGVLLPIPTADLCVNCHGARDKLAAGVGDALARLYPDDRATGFATGELRGWFWVEVH